MLPCEEARFLMHPDVVTVKEAVFSLTLFFPASGREYERSVLDRKSYKGIDAGFAEREIMNVKNQSLVLTGIDGRALFEMKTGQIFLIVD